MKRKLALLAAGLVAAGAMGIASAEVSVADKYVDTDGVWSETNNVGGLQRTATGANGEIPADTHDISL